MGTESPAGDLGTAAPRLSLPATDGRVLTLDDVRGERGVVVVFMCNHCPYVCYFTREAAEEAALHYGKRVIDIIQDLGWGRLFPMVQDGARPGVDD